MSQQSTTLVLCSFIIIAQAVLIVYMAGAPLVEQSSALELPGASRRLDETQQLQAVRAKVDRLHSIVFARENGDKDCSSTSISPIRQDVADLRSLLASNSTLPVAPTVHEPSAACTRPTWDQTAPLPHNFVPQTLEQYESAVFTIWTLLDSNMQLAPKLTRSLTPYGYMRPSQMQAYRWLAQAAVQTRGASARVQYCETGFNGGHGTAAMLLTSPQIDVHSWDLFAWGYSNSAVKLLNTYFNVPGGRHRFTEHRGNTRNSIPDFLATEKGRTLKCDIILVDGDHAAGGALADLRNMRSMATCNATVLIDDINEGPGIAIKQAAEEGLIEVVKRHHDSKSHNCVRKRTGSLVCVKGWGWAQVRYLGGC